MAFRVPAIRHICKFIEFWIEVDQRTNTNEMIIAAIRMIDAATQKLPVSLTINETHGPLASEHVSAAEDT